MLADAGTKPVRFWLRPVLVVVIILAQSTGAGMGAWGHGILENDGGADWICDMAERQVASVIDRALRSVSNDAGYVDVDEASEALAAADFVAAAAGHAASDYAKEFENLAKSDPKFAAPERIMAALGAVDRVLADSELNDLWKETEDYGKWRAVVEDLRSRLFATTGE